MLLIAKSIIALILLSSQGAGPATQALGAEAYVLGPDDEIQVRVLDLDEIPDRPIRIDANGLIELPLVGRLVASGLTVGQLEAEITARLRPVLKAPVVTVQVAEFRSHGVSVLGAVNTPGVIQVRGPKTIIEILSQAGGLRPEAGDTIKLTRPKASGPIPLKNSASDTTGQFYVAEISIQSLLNASDPSENILVKSGDVLSIPKADLVYVIGAVHRPGGFVISDHGELSVLEALSMAEGLERTAAAKRAKILRSSVGLQRSEVPVDVGKILSGGAADLTLRANDILFIPNNNAKSASFRAVEAVIQLGTGVAIYRR